MFISSLWDVKEPTHYSYLLRVGDRVPGVVAVLFFPSKSGQFGAMSLNGLWCTRLPKQTQPEIEKGLSRVGQLFPMICQLIILRIILCNNNCDWTVGKTSLFLVSYFRVHGKHVNE